MSLSEGSSLDVVWEQNGVRIVCAESMGHADDRLTPHDVLVAGSHTAVCAVELLLHLRLRAVIGHAAGPGLDDGGISGLPVLSRAGVPGAAVSGESAPIADGRAMYERGILVAVNDAAASMGVRPGMLAKDAACLLATSTLQPFQVTKVQHVVHDDEDGRVIALDTVGHADDRVNGAVICMGSHSGQSMADYVEKYELRGTVTNDAGMPLERSSVKGLVRLAARGIPAAVVGNDSARVGDGRSTWETGIVSEVNSVAEALHIRVGMRAQDSALLMLSAAKEQAS